MGKHYTNKSTFLIISQFLLVIGMIGNTQGQIGSARSTKLSIRNSSVVVTDSTINVRTDKYFARLFPSGLIEILIPDNSTLICSGGNFEAVYDLGLQESKDNPLIRVSNETKEEVTLNVTWKLDFVNVEVEYYFFTHRQNIDVTVRISYVKDLQVIHEKIGYKTPLTNIRGFDRQQRLVALSGLNRYTCYVPPYVGFGDSTRSFHLYGHGDIPQTDISIGSPSTVDFYLDNLNSHPFSYWYDDGKRKSGSPQIRTKGEEIKNRFSLWIGEPPVVFRKQLQPAGYEATLIWTDHADRQTAETLEAVFFGTTDRTSFDYSRKGFIGHGLKVSKTVFADTGDSFDEGLDDPNYRSVVDQLYVHNIEIGPHSVYWNVTEDELITAYRLFQKDYHSRIWIDHGRWKWDVAVEGFDPKSSFYNLDKLTQLGYSYIWSYWDQGRYDYYNSSYTRASPEEVLPFDKVGLSFNVLFPKNQEVVPLLISYNNRIDDDRRDSKKLWLFYTVPSVVPVDYYSQGNIDTLIEQRGVHVSHSYLAAIDEPYVKVNYKEGGELTQTADLSTKEFKLTRISNLSVGDLIKIDNEEMRVKAISGDKMTVVSRGYSNRQGIHTTGTKVYVAQVCIVDSTFDSYLNYIGSKVKAGHIWNPTISEWGDYLNQILKVDIQYTSATSSRVTNNNNNDIKDFCLAVYAADKSRLRIDGATIKNSKRVGNDLLVWFNLPAKSSREISIVPFTPSNGDSMQKALFVQKYPNPFDKNINISLRILKTSHVRVEIYDLLGRKVKTLFNGQAVFPNLILTWDGKRDDNREASDGVYFCRVKAGNIHQVEKITLLRMKR